MEQSVRLVNQGTEDFRHPYAQTMIEIPAGSERFVPFGVMVAFMGHPNLRNTEYENWRDESYSNLCLFYGALGIHGINPEKLPKLAAFDDQGNQVMTILDDPHGKKLEVTAQEHSDTAVMAQQIAEMKKLLELNGITADPNPTPTPPPAAGPVTDELPPTDEPVRIKVS